MSAMLLYYFFRCFLILYILGVFEKRVAIETAGIAMLKGEEVTRTNHSIPGCWLGGEFHLIGERWSPVIEPYGLMVCVKCQCATIHQEKTLQQDGKVMCRNIKYECPETRCPDPILRPKTCCKICRNQGPYFEDTFSLVQNDEASPVSNSATDNTVSHMTALLVGYDSRHTRAVALVHVAILSGNSFHYAIRYTRLRHPERIVLQDKFGTVFKQRRLQQTEKQGKICGIWRDVPPVYMQYMLQGSLYVSITTRNYRYGEIIGLLVEDKRYKTATFEGLLAPTRKTGAGGKFDIKYDKQTRSATFTIKIDNLKQSGRGVNDYFVTMEKDRKVAFQRVMRSTRDGQMLTGKIRLDNELSRRMARGRLYMRVTSRSGETLRGKVQPRLSCNSYMAVMVNSHDSSDVSYAVAEINEDSSLRYKVTISTPHAQIQEIMFTRLNVNRSIWKPMAIVTETYRKSQTKDGQSTGVYQKMRSIDTCSLLEQEVFANIRLQNNPKEVRGRMHEITYIEHIDIFKDQPLLLSVAKCSISVLVWLVVDSKCHVRYHITALGEENPPSTMRVKLTSTMYWNKFHSQNVTEYVFDRMSGIITTVPNHVFTSLQFGDNYIAISITDTQGCKQLRKPMFRPNQCWSKTVTNDLGHNNVEKDDGSVFRCYYNDRFYNHGESWLPADHECFTCRCQRGHAICDRVLCPPSNCSSEMIPNGQCCPVCEDDNSTEKKILGNCYFSGDKRWHPYGTTWHPYIATLGYSRCAVCSCIPGTGDINCTRLPCPVLDCPQVQRIRRDPDDCCQVCQATTEVLSQRQNKKKDSQKKKKGCHFGDRVYTHGETWHPSLAPFGEMKCYLCRCKNGDTRCSKIQCKPLRCVDHYRPTGQCCPVCLDDMHNKKSRRKSSNG